MNSRMLRTAGLASALLLLGILSLPDSLVAQASKVPELSKLLKDRSVTLVRAGTLFVPGKNGRAPRLVDGKKRWLVYRKGKLLGLVQEPKTPVEISRSQLRAKLLDYSKEQPQSFAGPGFVDADSRWFRSTNDLMDRQSNSTTNAVDALEIWQKGWQDLLTQSGVTSVFVPASVNAQSSGAGALITIATRKPEVLAQGALGWRLSSPQTKGTNLTRASVVKGLSAALSSARKYGEAKDKYKKDLEEYAKKRKTFLAYYKKHPLKKGEQIKSATPKPKRRRRSRLPKDKAELERMLKRVPPAIRERLRKQMEARMKAAAAQAAKEKAAAASTKKPASSKSGSKQAPAKPKRPKKPKHDPAKEALLRVLTGKSLLRIEVHRAGEIRALLTLAKEEGIDQVTIVGGSEAWKTIKELRVSGASVVLRPEKLPSKGFATLPEQLASSAARLAAENIPVAFGSAGRARGASLRLLAARAVARGMQESQALQALTQAALESSGLSAAQEVDPGLVIWSGNPLASSSHPIALVRGRRVRKFIAQ